MKDDQFSRWWSGDAKDKSKSAPAQEQQEQRRGEDK